MKFGLQQLNSVRISGRASLKYACIVEFSQAITESLFAVDLSLDGARHVNNIKEEREFFRQFQMGEAYEGSAVNDGDAQLFLRKTGKQKEAHSDGNQCTHGLSIFLVKLLLSQKSKNFAFESSWIAVHPRESKNSVEFAKKGMIVDALFYYGNDQLALSQSVIEFLLDGRTCPARDNC